MNVKAINKLKHCIGLETYKIDKVATSIIATISVLEAVMRTLTKWLRKAMPQSLRGLRLFTMLLMQDSGSWKKYWELESRNNENHIPDRR